MEIFNDNSTNIKIEDNCMIVTWKPTSKNWKDIDATSAVTKVIEEVEKHRPKGVVYDTRTLYWALNPEWQQWFDNNITPRYIKAGIKKWSMLMPEGIVEKMSMEQLFDESKAKESVATRAFSTIEEAKRWALED